MAQQPNNGERRARTIPNGSSSQRPAQQQRQPGVVDQVVQQFQQLPPDQQQRVMQFAMQNFPRTAQNASRMLDAMQNNPEYAGRMINESRNGSFSPHAFRGEADPHEPQPIFSAMARSLGEQPQQVSANVPTPPTRPANASQRSQAPARRTAAQAEVPQPPTRPNTEPAQQDASGNEVAFQPRAATGRAQGSAPATQTAAAPQARGSNNALIRGAGASPAAASVAAPRSNDVPPEEVRRVDDENRAAQEQYMNAVAAQGSNASAEPNVFQRIMQSLDANMAPREDAARVRETIGQYMPAMPTQPELMGALRLGAQPLVNAAQGVGNFVQDIPNQVETIRQNVLPITNAIRRAQGQPEQSLPPPVMRPHPSKGQRVNPNDGNEDANNLPDSGILDDGIERRLERSLD